MRMNPARLYDRVLAGDPADDGRFFFGVTTTGIYCLPSCKARKPRPENTRFFPTAEAARAAGLRACKKCHPDDFARGADPVLESIERLVAEIRADPAAFPDARAVVRRSGFGATRLFEFFRRHYHATPADLLLRARLAQTRRRLLATDAPLADIAYDAGFQSLSVFHEHFRALHGLTPLACRELRSAAAFDISLPAGYPLALLKRALGRDPESLSERLDGDTFSLAVRPGADRAPFLLRLRLAPGRVRVEIAPPHAPEAHAIALSLLGLDQDAAAFARLTRKLGLARLVAGREQLRLVQTPSVFDGLLWAVIGQQINLPFAFRLRQRLTKLAGTPVADGLFAPPAPADLAGRSPEELRPLQFSRAKAACIIGVARLVATGRLDLDALRDASATRAERTLLAIRGLGPWSVNYLMMRSLGFADCAPLGDTGVTSGLQTLFALDERPDRDAVKSLMSVFAPHRSLATAHLWQINQPTLADFP